MDIIRPTAWMLILFANPESPPTPIPATYDTLTECAAVATAVEMTLRTEGQLSEDVEPPFGGRKLHEIFAESYYKTRTVCIPIRLSAGDIEKFQKDIVSRAAK